MAYLSFLQRRVAFPASSVSSMQLNSRINAVAAAEISGVSFIPALDKKVTAMTETVSVLLPRERAKYSHLRRLRAISRAILNLTFLAILADCFFSFPLRITYVLYGFSMVFSIIGICCVAASRWRSEEKGG